MIFTFVLFVLTVLLGIYVYLRKNYNYWKIQDVPSARDAIAGFGHILPLLTLRDNFSTFMDKLYQKMGKRSMYGCYLMQTPALLVRDPELIKCVLQKNFSNFRHNILSVHGDLDPIMSKNPFFAKDEVWTMSRVQLASSFSGKKMRYLFANVVQVCEKFINYIDRTIENQSDNELELKNLFERVVGEIVANYGFGIEGQSFHDKPDYHSFTSVTRRFFDANTSNALRQTLTFFLPTLAHRIGVRFLPKETDAFIRNHLSTFMKSVRQSDSVKKDCFQFPAEELNEVDPNMTIALATSIFFDGYEATNTVLNFMMYRLAENPLIQDKARDEVNRILEEYNNQLTYEATKRMSYLDQIIEETLRMHPVFGDLSRVCTEKITLKGYDGLTCRLKPGDVLLISPGCTHMDEEFWPNPSVFDPERFSAVNKAARNRYTYLGFSEGKRICPGRRMGMMMVKAIAAVVLQTYELEMSSRSKDPLRINTNAFASVIEGGLWVKFRRFHVEN